MGAASCNEDVILVDEGDGHCVVDTIAWAYTIRFEHRVVTTMMYVTGGEMYVFSSRRVQ